MTSKITDMPRFLSALDDPYSIVIDGRDRWERESIPRRFLRWVFRLDNSRARNLLKFFNERLGSLETAENQKNLIGQDQFLAAIKKLKGCLKYSKSAEVQDELMMLRRHKHALKFRCGLSFKYVNTDVESDARLDLSKYAEEFNKGKLSEVQKKQLDTVFAYPKLVNMILKNEFLRNELFTWTVRNHCSADVFAVLPHLQTQLKVSYIASRIGRDEGETLLFRKREDGVYDASLPFESEYISVLDENRAITNLQGTASIRLKDFYRVFENKNYDVGNFEYFAKLKHEDTYQGKRFGFVGHHIHHFGYYDENTKQFVRDLEGKFYLKQRATERFTAEELLKRYPKIEEELMDKGELENFRKGFRPWFKLLTASRTTKDLSPTGTHGWLKTVVPIDGKYNVYDIGKVAQKFPYWWWEYIPIFFQFVKAAFESPEQNLQYSHREIDYTPRIVNEDEGLATMELIKEDLLLSEKGESKFNIVYLSCGSWAVDRWNPPKRKEFAHIPFVNPMDMYYLDLDAGPIFKALGKTHRYFQMVALGSWGFFLGTWIPSYHTQDGERKLLCLLTDYPYNRSTLPAQLFRYEQERRRKRQLMLSAAGVGALPG